jgi:hypothetical protein
MGAAMGSSSPLFGRWRNSRVSVDTVVGGKGWLVFAIRGMGRVLLLWECDGAGDARMLVLQLSCGHGSFYTLDERAWQ